MRQKHTKTEVFAHKHKIGVCCRLDDHFWTWDLPWSVVDTPSVPPLRKTDVPFPRRHQLQFTSW